MVCPREENSTNHHGGKLGVGVQHTHVIGIMRIFFVNPSHEPWERTHIGGLLLVHASEQRIGWHILDVWQVATGDILKDLDCYLPTWQHGELHVCQQMTSDCLGTNPKTRSTIDHLNLEECFP